MLRPETEYQEKYKNEHFVEEHRPVHKRLSPAGLPLKGLLPEYDDATATSKDLVLPRFTGESMTKSAHGPQPPITRLRPYQPSAAGTESGHGHTRTGSFPAHSYSNSVYCPMPKELVEQTRNSSQKKPWKKPEEVRHDLVSCYQADYCGLRTRAKRICLVKDCNGAGGDSANSVLNQNPMPMQKISDWENSLHYLTTYTSTHLPPSVHGGACCHPVKYHRRET